MPGKKQNPAAPAAPPACTTPPPNAGVALAPFARHPARGPAKRLPWPQDHPVIAAVSD
jgi:hypothetical protein